MALKYVQSNTLYLAGSGVIIGATSITLTSLTDIYGTVLDMTSFGDKGYITLEPDTTNEEAATFTGITANTNGTYTLTGVSSGLAQSPYTETSGLVRQHAGGTKVVITDNVEFWNTFTNKNNDETIEGLWTFSQFPITPSNTPATTSTIGLVKVSVAPASAPSPIAVETTDPRVPVAYAVDSVGTDAYAITPSPAITAYAAGQTFTFKAGTANTGAATLNVNALGAKTIKKGVSVDLATGDILSGQIVVVKYDGTNMQLQNPFISAPIVHVYTSSNTWTKPTGLKYIIAEVVGGGGGGGAASGATRGAGGGGGGGYSRELLAAATLGATETYVVGAGGTAGQSGGAAAGAGVTSSFGTSPYLQATGGGAGTVASSTQAVGGAGGVGSNGDLNIEGGDGGTGGASGIAVSGMGGSSYYGGGGVNQVTTGQPGTAPGDGNVYGGGGGGAALITNSAANGGAGAAGVVIVTEFY